MPRGLRRHYPGRIPLMQRRLIAVLSLLCAYACIVSGQTPSPGTPPPPLPPLHGERKRAGLAAMNASTANASGVGLDQPVITLKGACEPIGDMVPSKDCVRMIT